MTRLVYLSGQLHSEYDKLLAQAENVLTVHELTGGRPKELQLVATGPYDPSDYWFGKSHAFLAWADQAKVKVWYRGQDFTKDRVGPEAGNYIPMQASKGYVHRDEFPLDFRVGERAEKLFHFPDEEKFRLYKLKLIVTSGTITCRWCREDGGNDMVTHELYPFTGEKEIIISTLESNDWRLWLWKAEGDPLAQVVEIVEYDPPQNQQRDLRYHQPGWYGFLGSGNWEERFMVGCGSVDWGNILERNAVYARCQRLVKAIHSHRSFYGIEIGGNEPFRTGWTEGETLFYTNAGQAYAREIVKAAATTARMVPAGKTLCMADGFTLNTYSRANNPRNGGYKNALQYLPKSTRAKLIVLLDYAPTLHDTDRFQGYDWIPGSQHPEQTKRAAAFGKGVAFYPELPEHFEIDYLKSLFTGM